MIQKVCICDYCLQETEKGKLCSFSLSQSNLVNSVEIDDIKDVHLCEDCIGKDVNTFLFTKRNKRTLKILSILKKLVKKYPDSPISGWFLTEQYERGKKMNKTKFKIEKQLILKNKEGFPLIPNEDMIKMVENMKKQEDEYGYLCPVIDVFSDKQIGYAKNFQHENDAIYADIELLSDEYQVFQGCEFFPDRYGISRIGMMRKMNADDSSGRC